MEYGATGPKQTHSRNGTAFLSIWLKDEEERKPEIEDFVRSCHPMNSS
jgi:hypothetical protein